MFHVLVTLLASTITLATALEPYENFEEGSCSINQFRPIRANREFIDSLKYITAGSRYNLYLAAASLPNYPVMREDQFYYDACYSRNTTTTEENSIGAMFGFGRPLFTLKITTRPGIYLEGVPTDPALSSNHIIDILTLTDHKSFAFLANCWAEMDQRSWTVVSSTPHLDLVTERIIEEHAISLGFKRENFVFLRHDSCWLASPRWEMGLEDNQT